MIATVMITFMMIAVINRLKFMTLDSRKKCSDELPTDDYGDRRDADEGGSDCSSDDHIDSNRAITVSMMTTLDRKKTAVINCQLMTTVTLVALLLETAMVVTMEAVKVAVKDDRCNDYARDDDCLHKKKLQ